MGCTSSTEVVTDPHTGQEKTKKKLGGAYPGQRRPQHQPYVPSADQFGKDGQATAHFIAYGGGNALTLVRQDGSSQPQVGKPQSTYVQVTLPDGVSAGQTIHVQAPDGRLNAIVVPPGFGPGSTFTVEFAPDEAPPPAPAAAPAAATGGAAGASTDAPIPGVFNPYGTTAYSSGYSAATTYEPTPTPPPPAAAGDRPDDGFASGFNNPYWNPPASAVPPNEPDVYAYTGLQGSSNYPTTTATPIYNAAPQYAK